MSHWGCAPPVSNEIEIVVRVKDQAAAGMQAIRAEVKTEGEAAAAEADKAGSKIGENLVGGLTRDSQGRLRNAMGRFASDAEKEAAGLGGIKLPIEVPKDDFEAEFRKAMEEGEQVASRASAEMRRSFTAVESGSRSLRAAMADLEPAAHEAGAGLEGAGRMAEGAGRKAESSGGGFSMGAARMTAMIAAAITLAPALAALPAVAGAAATGVATMALGLGGVIKALHDYGAASTAGGQSGAQLAATAFSNAVAIKNAEQAITDAKKQAARSAEDSAEQIKNAQQGVVDAERQAATATQSSADQIAAAQRGVADAAYNLAQAEQRLQDAEKAELDAQKALTQAREDAANQLKDLNNAAADSHLAVERATLNVSKAQENLAKVLSSSLSTDDQKKDAQLALQEAQQGLIDAQQRSVEASQKADAANKSGVDGMQSVVAAQDAVTKSASGVQDAQHGVAQAQQAQADAQQALVRAQQSAADQQISSAQAIAKAQQSLVDAERTADRQRQDSMEAVAKAEQNLSDTYKQQQLAAAAAASAGGGAANKFAQDMANLTPAGQAFVKQLLSMKDGAKELSDTAQTAMLPGLTTMLKDSGPLLPIFNNAIRDMGGVIGGTAVKFGDLMKSPAFQGQLTQVLSDGSGLAQKLGDGLVGMVQGVMGAASKAGPVVGALGDGIKTLMTSGIPDFLNGLLVNAPGAGDAIQGIFGIVNGLLGPLGQLAGSLSGALGPALKDLVKPVSDLADKISKSLQPMMGPLSKALDAVAKVLSQVLVIIEPIIPLIAEDFTNALIILTPILDVLAKFLGANHGWLTKLFEIVHYLLDPMAALTKAFDYARDHMGQWRDFLKHLWSDVKQWFDDGVHGVAVAWGKIEDGAKSAWGLVHDYIVNPIEKASKAISDKFDTMVKTVKDLPGKFVGLGDHLWDWVGSGFKLVANGVISGFNWVIDQINNMTQSVSDVWSWAGIPSIDHISHLSKLASGGALGQGGLSAIIGERGGELMTLPDGTQVMPHANTQSQLAQGSGRGGATEVHLVWESHGADDELFTWIRRHIRIVAGNGPNSVQTALGQAF